jgi:hypothetical protein
MHAAYQQNHLQWATKLDVTRTHLKWGAMSFYGVGRAVYPLRSTLLSLVFEPPPPSLTNRLFDYPLYNNHH